MRRLRMLFVVAVALSPATAGAKSIHTAECEAVCANPDPSVDQNLSPDPRTFATIANGYTSYWQVCHAETDAVQQPKTCREWCASRERGRALLETSGLIGSFLDADTYNNLWRAWGALERPPDFDQHIVERYGLQPAPFPNPYPLPGEDPATANGGSGQLPMGLVQTRSSSGQYDGGIGFTCLLCHAGRIGDATPERPDLGSRIGIGNTTFDIEVFSYDLGKAGGVPIPLPYPHNQGRGTINAVSDFEFLMTLRDFDTLDSTPFVKAFPAHASPGDQDPPAWHNTGSRPRVYMDGGVSADNTRALMQFLTASITTNSCTDVNAEKTPGCGAWIKTQEHDFEDIRTFIESIEPPAFPRSGDPASPQYIDAASAAHGEELFHCKNLFGPDLSADAQGCAQETSEQKASGALFGNGSCSSCHGVYSATYASRLPDPSMVGVAGRIVPRDFVRTDPGRVDALSRELRWGWGTLWFAYADNSTSNAVDEVLNDYVTEETNGLLYTRAQGRCGWVGVDEQSLGQFIGYAAPALHGVWSTAPYLHNGSVPTVYHVLRYEERPTFWRRPLSTPGTPPDQGFDVSLGAYDFAKVGWKFECLLPDGTAVDSCLPLGPAVPATGPATPGSQVWLANQSPRPLTQADIELRKMYDTTAYGRSNEGHWWTSRETLSESEVEDLLEYVKTL